MVAGDVQLRPRWRGGRDEEQQQAEERDAHGGVTAKTLQEQTGLEEHPKGPAGEALTEFSLATLVWGIR
jgi:hypothetical protein